MTQSLELHLIQYLKLKFVGGVDTAIFVQKPSRARLWMNPVFEVNIERTTDISRCSIQFFLQQIGEGNFDDKYTWAPLVEGFAS